MLIAKTNELPYFLFTIKRNIFAKRVSKLIESAYSVLIYVRMYIRFVLHRRLTSLNERRNIFVS